MNLVGRPHRPVRHQRESLRVGRESAVTSLGLGKDGEAISGGADDGSVLHKGEGKGQRRSSTTKMEEGTRTRPLVKPSFKFRGDLSVYLSAPVYSSEREGLAASVLQVEAEQGRSVNSMYC